MDRQSKCLQISRGSLCQLGLCAILLGSSICLAGVLPTGSKAGPVQFDAILELNAASIRTHIVLFARYWVAPDYYAVSIVWAEPHVPNLNFAMQPVTLTINNNREAFRLTSQTDSWVNSVFSKPVGPRGVFRYMFNDYPVANARFAEEEARATRLYADDFRDANESNAEPTLVVSSTGDVSRTARSVAKVKMAAVNGRARRLDLLDKEGRVIKTLEYEYGEQENGSLLWCQKVTLPEDSLTAGFDGEGIRVKIDGETHRYNEIAAPFHPGSRLCTVQYEPTQIGCHRLALPTSVSVQNGATRNIVRAVRLLDFKPVAFEEKELPRVAEDVGRFGPEMLRCQQMAARYRFRAPSLLGDGEKQTLRGLQAFFERGDDQRSVVGKELRRINMLLQTDWMLGDSDHLLRHFNAYMDVLNSCHLGQMALTGGQSLIETTALWGYFDAANTLLPRWVERCISICDAESILRFARDESGKGKFWTSSKLAEAILQRGPDRPAVSFDAQALRCIALCGLRQHLQDPEQLRREFDIVQVGWVSRCADSEKLLVCAAESLTKAKEAYQNLQQPTEGQKAILAQLDKLAPAVLRREE